MSSSPCMCGSPDCKRCFPSLQRIVECKRCGEEYPAWSLENGICEKCQNEMDEEEQEQ